jgi:hypothetical protein
MARTWLTVKVELVGGRGEFLWPRPGRVIAAKPTHTFRQLADTINEAFARWDRSHLHLFSLHGGEEILPLAWWDDADDEALDDATEHLRRLALGDRFVFVFDLGDDWAHLCTVGTRKVDIIEVAGVMPTEPITVDGWGDIPDQYGRRWEQDDGDEPLPPQPDPPTRDLPPLVPGWGEEAFASVPSGPPVPSEVVGLWRPLGWTHDAVRNLRGAVARRDSHAVLGALVGRDPVDVAHLAAPALLAALAEGDTAARGYALLLIDELRERWWDGDHALADELAGAAGAGPPTGLRNVPVALDELAMHLTNRTQEAEPFRLHLPTGRFWPSDLMVTGEEPPEDWEDEKRWLEMSFAGSADGWHDMSDFIATVEDGELSEQLDEAIRGRGAFRRFADRLRPHEPEWTRWRLFKDERDLGRARAFLAEAGYRPTAVAP